MKKTSTIKIGKKIQEIRKSNGYTQEKLAEAIEVSVRHISDIEQDRAKPSYEILIKICNIFNIGIVIGLPVAILGGISKIAFSYIDLIVMIGTALLLFIFSRNDYKIKKREGIAFLIIFVIYYSYVILG